MEIHSSEPWFGRRRPWLWLGASFGACAVFALLAWWLVARSAHSAVELERARSPYAASFQNPERSTPEPDALAAWVEQLDRLYPEPYYEGQWPSTSLPSAGPTFRATMWSGFVHPGLSSTQFAPPSVESTPAECSASNDAIESHPRGIEGWLGDHLANPNLAAQSSECLRTLLRERIGPEALRAHALTARDLARADGRLWLARMERDDRPEPEPALNGVPAVIRHLSAFAALKSLEGDVAAARGAIEAALGLCDSLAGLGWHAAYVRWLDCERMALRAVAACLALAPEAVDGNTLARHLDRIDAQARHSAACEVQRALCDRAYGRMLAGKACGAEHFDLSPESPGWRIPLLERERADAIASWRRYAEWAREPLATRGGPPTYARHLLASDECASTGLGATTFVSNEALAQLETQIATLRIALAASRDGLAAANAEASRLAASAGGRTLSLRPETDGVIVIEARPAAAGGLEDSALDVFVRARP